MSGRNVAARGTKRRSLWLLVAALAPRAAAAPFGDAEAFERAARASGLAESRPRLVELNARRMRELPAPRRGLLVNIPAFEAYLLDEGRAISTWRVIVGSPSTPTPELGSRIDAVVLNPAWAVPHGPPARRIWETSRSSPTFFETHRMVVTLSSAGTRAPVPPETWTDPTDVRYRLTQAPGPGNPLGRVLFRFPNPFGVWLHDTSEPAVFRRRDRAVTLGCVRIERPTALAARLLAGRGWTASQLEREASTGKTSVIRLSEPFELRLAYWTAWLDAEGTVRTIRDIYGRDEPASSPAPVSSAAVRCEVLEHPPE